jgi:hypothetical protein
MPLALSIPLEHFAQQLVGASLACIGRVGPDWLVLGLLAVVMLPYSLIDVMVCFVFANALMWGYYLMQFDTQTSQALA